MVQRIDPTDSSVKTSSKLLQVPDASKVLAVRLCDSSQATNESSAEIFLQDFDRICGLFLYVRRMRLTQAIAQTSVNFYTKLVLHKNKNAKSNANLLYKILCCRASSYMIQHSLFYDGQVWSRNLQSEFYFVRAILILKGLIVSQK